MGKKFNEYGKRVDKIAREAFEEFRRAEKKLADAEAKAKQYPQRGGMVDARYAAESARAQADLLEAREEMKEAQQAFEGRINEIKAIRKELAAEVETTFAADPSALDFRTLELLKSGILKPSEYERLIDKAQEAENYTMARTIAKYAGDAADEIDKIYGANSQQAFGLRAVSFKADQSNGNAILQAFDVLSETFTRCTTNPPMIDDWDNLTGDIIEKM